MHSIAEQDGSTRLVFMSRESGTLLYLDLEFSEWIAAYDGTTLSYIEKHGNPWPRPPGCRTLTEAEVDLPRRFEDFPGYAEGAFEQPHYGLTDLWQHFLIDRAQQRAVAAAAQLPPTTQPSSASSAHSSLEVSPVAGSLETPLGSQPALLASASAAAPSPRFVVPRPPGPTRSLQFATAHQQAPSMPAPSTVLLRPPFQPQFAAPTPGSAQLPPPLTLLPPSTVSGVPATQPLPTRASGTASASSSTGHYTGAFSPYTPGSQQDPSAPVEGPGDRCLSPLSYVEDLIRSHSVESSPAPEDRPQRSVAIPFVTLPERLPMATLDFLQNFSTQRAEGGPVFHTRAELACLEGMGYALEESLPPIGSVPPRDVSLNVFLQYIDRASPGHVLSLDLDSIGRLIDRLFPVLYPALGRRTVTPNMLTAEMVIEAARFIVLTQLARCAPSPLDLLLPRRRWRQLHQYQTHTRSSRS